MLQQSTDHLAQPYSQATLNDHFDMWVRLERHREPLTSEVLRFFELEDVELATRQLRYAEFETPNVHRALARCCPDWQLVFAGGHSLGYRDVVWAPVSKRFEMRPGRFANYLVEGSQFYRLPDGSKRVVAFELTERGDVSLLEVTLVAPRCQQRQLNREIAALTRWLRRHHYLRGQALRADGTLLGKKARIDWDALALDPAVRASLEANICGLLSQRDLFRRNGIPQKRGILLYGPPGTGKTMVGKVLAGLAGNTYIWATAADFACAAAVRQVFSLARKLKPSIVFLEDLDLYAGDRSGGATVTLGELLSQMDGLEENDGLIVVATTNDLAAVEPAMRDRPSRFDVVLEVGLPAVAARRQILASNLALQKPDAEMLDRAASETTGLSGAQVREVAVLAIQKALLRHDIRPDGTARLAAADFAAAIEQITGCRKKSIGFCAS